MRKVILLMLFATSAHAEVTMPEITVEGKQPAAVMIITHGDDVPCPVEEVQKAMQGLPNACKPPSWQKK